MEEIAWTGLGSLLASLEREGESGVSCVRTLLFQTQTLCKPFGDLAI